MKQYCRYCANAYLQGDNLIWCDKKEQMRSDHQITSLNKCKDFDFCPIDVLDPKREYKPREHIEPRESAPGEDTITENQLSLFQEEQP